MPDAHPKPRRVRSVAEWEERARPRTPLGRWLVDNMPRGANLDPPGARKSARATPFVARDAE